MLLSCFPQPRRAAGPRALLVAMATWLCLLGPTAFANVTPLQRGNDIDGCGLNITMGLPVERYDGAATIYAAVNSEAGSTSVVPELDEIQRIALANPEMESTLPNSSEWRTACIPSANGFADARSLAELYSALASDGQLAGKQLVDRATQSAMREVQSSGLDRVLAVDARWGCGFLINSLGIYGPNPNAFGHSGWGGSFAFGDPDRGMGCAYVMNQMGTDLVGDPRNLAMVSAVYRSLGVSPG